MKKFKIFFFAAVIGLIISACEYNFLVEEELPPINGGGNGEETVYFSTDIQPIFTANCAGCHNTGGRAPDLSAGKAYQSIGNAKYINVSSPEQSLIYAYPGPGTSTHTQKKYTAAQAQLILVWIQEGAKNN